MHTSTSPTRLRGITLRAADELPEGRHFGLAGARAAGMCALVAAGTYHVIEIDGRVVAGSG